MLYGITVKALKVAILATFLICGVNTAWAEGPIGQVKEFSGSATATFDGEVRELALGSDIFLNDDLITSADSSLGLMLNDGTSLSLGSRSRLVVDEFIYNPGRGNVGLGMTIFAGALSYASGKIARINPDAVTVRSAIATIGVRGTRFLMRLPDRFTPEGEE